MASATGIPQQPPAGRGDEESEPLLGRPGDASQKPAASIAKNLILAPFPSPSTKGRGSASATEHQSGVRAYSYGISSLHEATPTCPSRHLQQCSRLPSARNTMAKLMYWCRRRGWRSFARCVRVGSSLPAPPYILFSVHPLAQSFGLLVLIQSILIVQPTVTAEQKKVGQKLHAGLNFLALASFIVGVGSIEYKKIRSNGAHFKSPHAYIGVVASIWQILQYLVGFTMYGTPQLYGGEAKAKAIWKYHRISGYGLLLLYMAAVTSATKTDYNVNVLGLKLWAAIVIALLILAGIYPRIKKQKLGL
ncbi:eukaryotic cytochrome b561-domain-containing protein [Microdochium trichocladiopsis]|uniref:Eukaryotic cytochrome b561-domain-containing protein n=1 Tax=Microdochium trichocladiopsis TaxID=1682393 RepID=A0A9P8XQZ8_9PEZI|nr:eukaryotic cytochrome b561-domain-containing protein [Microdochium trichocladiopsis]KAH7012495.1 eukaryotic cytochrome b561-domain-containing protein [Microdochium trichocladiopsis]